MDRVRGLGRAMFRGGAADDRRRAEHHLRDRRDRELELLRAQHPLRVRQPQGVGWITLIIGILEMLASLSLFGGGEYGRWFAIVVGALAALGALLSIPAYPLWSIAIFALSLWIIYGLVIYGEPEPTEGAGVSQGVPPPRTAPGSPPRT